MTSLKRHRITTDEKMAGKLDRRIALVTGGTSGIKPIADHGLYESEGGREWF
jgi:hypothetical protein